MFNNLDGFIEAQGDNTEYNNAGNYHIKLEYLGTIYDQIAESPFCCQKFSNDNPHQCQADIYFCSTQQDGDGTGEYHLEKGIASAAAQGIDQSNFLRIHLLESGIKADDGTKDGNGHTCHDNGFSTGAEPYDKQRRQS